MKIPLPKEMIGLKFDKLCYIDLNNFDVETLLPALFWLARSGGRNKVGQGNNLAKITIEERTARLAAHDCIKGFDSEDGVRLLNKWVRSSLIETSRVGRTHKKGEQIAHLKPLTFLTYKPHLRGNEGSQWRQTHLFLYALCQDFIARQNRTMSKSRDFETCLRNSFGEGLRLESGREKKGAYDRVTPLDVEVLLQMYYMDGFPAPLEQDKVNVPPPQPSCSRAASYVARDFLDFLDVYAKHVPALALGRYITCLLNFELLIYTLHVAKAANRLVFHAEDPPEFDKLRDPTSLEIYVDLTQIRGSRSDLLANACVNRDIEGWEEFYRASLTLRTLIVTSPATEICNETCGIKREEIISKLFGRCVTTPIFEQMHERS